MAGNVIALLLFTVFLVFANGFFVAAEFALVKVRSTQLEVAEAEGARLAGLARHLVHHLDSYLSATQLGITLTSLGLGWIGEPAVAHVLEPLFHAVGLPDDLQHRVAVVVGFTVISFAHIVLGEVAPKSLAIARPVGVSLAVAVPMRLFHMVFYPALVLLNASSNLVLRLVGIEPAGTHSLAVAEEELVRIAEESALGGQITPSQGAMLSNVFAFSHRVAREIMVPRTRVHGIDLDEPIQPQLQDCLEHGHSRYPVYDGDLDNLVGILHLKELLRGDLARTTAEDIRALARPPLYVPEPVAAERVMRRMQAARTHMAVVVDEHGGISGIVTLEDVLEELVGDIQDEFDEEAELVHATDSGFALTGSVPLDEVADLLQVAKPRSVSDTLQGWLMERLERLPRVGDEVSLGAWVLRVVEVQGRLATRIEACRADDPAAGKDDAE